MTLPPASRAVLITAALMLAAGCSHAATEVQEAALSNSSDAKAVPVTFENFGKKRRLVYVLAREGEA